MARVQFKNISKYFGEKPALDDITLEIDDKTFVCILGPTGAGKTTLLRTIAGLEQVDAGHLFFEDQEITDLPLQKRDVSMVFQDFTLYPNLIVFENIASPLRARKAPRSEIKRQVKEIAEILKIDHLLERIPRQLSGGEMQRVAIARAVAKRPGVYLFDEILVNLDYKIREQMRAMLKDLARELGSTVIYATPDPLDVLSMAEKVIVLNEGRIKQYGETFDVYRNPCDSFIGKYFGYPEMNFIEGRLSAGDSKITFQFEGNDLEVTPMRTQLEGLLESSVILGIRPEDIYIENSLRNTEDFAVEGTLLLGEVIGSDTILHLECAAVKMKVFVPEIRLAKPGQRLLLHFGLRDCHFFNAADSKLICRG